MTSSSIIFLIFVSLISLVQSNEPSNCVQTKLGNVCGFEEEALGKTVVTHLGIPFAQPPVGDLRFRAPKPLEKRDSVIDGTKYGKSCLQYVSDVNPVDFMNSWTPKISDISEDCLYLNIRAPKGAKNLPVMVNIHGGAFMFGSGTISSFNSPALSLQGNVVYVTINYRLGILGFGYLGNDEMPGNMGLLDQQMAIEWVKEHVAKFGGNPENITIFGESAGGASVAWHLVSEKSRNLFTGAIIQSGTIFSPWASVAPEQAQNNLRELAELHECGAEDDSALIACLRQMPGYNLTVLPVQGLETFIAPVTPCVPFFNGDAFEMLQNLTFENFKILLGSTKEETTLLLPFYTFFALGFDNITNWYLDQNQYHLYGRPVYQNADNDTIFKLFKKYDAIQNLSDVQRLIRLTSDHSFTCATLGFARFLSQTNKNGVYFYRFDYVAQEPVIMPIELGATHASDVAFTLGAPLTDAGWGDEDKLFAKEVVGYWSSLAKTGFPSSDWPPVTSWKNAEMKILQLGSTEVVTEHPDDICDLVLSMLPGKEVWQGIEN